MLLPTCSPVNVLGLLQDDHCPEFVVLPLTRAIARTRQDKVCTAALHQMHTAVGTEVCESNFCCMHQRLSVIAGGTILMYTNWHADLSPPYPELSIAANVIVRLVRLVAAGMPMLVHVGGCTSA